MLPATKSSIILKVAQASRLQWDNPVVLSDQKMKFLSTNKKQFVLSAVVFTSYILALVGMTQALPKPQVPSVPLSPNDPAAKLDPSLLNVPPIPEGKIDTSSTSENSQSTSKVESYDIETGTVQVGESKPVNPSSKSPQVSPPFRGAN